MNQIGYLLIDAIELGLIWSILSLGIYLSYRVFDYSDLTAEGSLTLGAAVSATYITQGVDPFMGLLLGTLSGVLAGAFTGIIHIKLKVPALLAGIISMTALYSINLKIMGQANLSLLNQANIFASFYNDALSNQIMRILVTVIFVLFIFFLLYWFFGTEIGMSLRATGMNQTMARAQGISTKTMIVVGLALSNGLVGLCGALLAQSQGFADINMGRGVIVVGLASIIIGEVLFGKRSFKNCLISTILGSVIYYILLGIAMRLGIDPNDLKLLSALLIVLILATPLIKVKLISKKRKRGDLHA